MGVPKLGEPAHDTVLCRDDVEQLWRRWPSGELRTPGDRGCRKSCPLQNGHVDGVLFELFRRFVAERGMQPHTVVVAVDEFRDVGAEMIQGRGLVRVDFLPLQRHDP